MQHNQYEKLSCQTCLEGTNGENLKVRTISLHLSVFLQLKSILIYKLVNHFEYRRNIANENFYIKKD